jgi:hypothetical protein
MLPQIASRTLLTFDLECRPLDAGLDRLHALADIYTDDEDFGDLPGAGRAMLSRVSPMKNATFMMAHECGFSALMAVSVPSPSWERTYRATCSGSSQTTPVPW